MSTSSHPLPQRVARPASSAFSETPAAQARTTGLAQAEPRRRSAGGVDVPGQRPAWSLRVERVELPATVTEFWSVPGEVARCEQALVQLVAASRAAGAAGFDAPSRTALTAAWSELGGAVSDAGAAARAGRVASTFSGSRVALPCSAAQALLASWGTVDPARAAFDLTGDLLTRVVEAVRGWLVAEATTGDGAEASSPELAALLGTFVAHVHPLGSQRPTADGARELAGTVAELARLHPDAASRDAFGQCSLRLGQSG